jgi:FKBP-type peptidyl-prolyl cis-trans isomerase
MRQSHFFLAALMVMGLLACESGSQTQYTEGGYPYEIYSAGGTEKPQTGDWVFYHFAQRVGDRELSSTKNNPMAPTPSYRITGEELEADGNPNAVFEVLMKLSPGDSASIAIPFDSLAPAIAMQATQDFPDDSVFYVNLELLEIQTDEEFTGGAVGRLEEVNAQYQEGTLEGVQYTQDSLGYYIMTEGSGEYPGDTAMVSVDYYGIFADGRMFDNSFTRGEPYSFQLGKEGNVIEGWAKGIPLLKEGTEAVLFIPYQLAYGENGRGGIPPRTDLVFYVKLVRIDS